MKLSEELKDFWFYLRRQMFLRIPSVSALAALFVAGWVSTTFTTSPTRAFMVRAGWVKGSRHYVETKTYRVMAIGLPVLTAAVTAWVVQRRLRRRRDTLLANDIATLERQKSFVKQALRQREAVLEEALKFGLLTKAEYAIKRADLYATYARDGGSYVERLISTKLT